jgi:hypothetical protein
MLQLLAEQKGFGPTRLARYAGHSSHGFMSRMLRGDVKARWVTPTTAARVSEALGVPQDLLFEAPEVKSLDSTVTAA